ncbi:pentatricopeptide repeat-containing protein At4g04370 [Aristolochia californica]|uniref:pentatricopeptide repeat-containing protein At4g04370 n=1 Tax=Aristolochia californica TaxID=171875 RepID=UPI0035DE4D52
MLFSYVSMLQNGIPPDSFTFSILLKASTSLGVLPFALFIHQHIIVHGYMTDVYIASSLIHMYARRGDISQAHNTFSQMHMRNVVPWTAIVSCYALKGDMSRAFSIYNQMRQQSIQPNSITFLSLLSGISELVYLQCVHACIVRYGFEFDIMVANSLLNIYNRCREVKFARKLFEAMSLRDIVSWNSLISGYAQNGCLKESVDLLNKMRTIETGPDQQTLASVASVVANEGDLRLGKSIHAQVIVSGIQSDKYVVTTLIGMYLKYRETNTAFQLFDQVETRDVISWTGMISGLVQSNQADVALLVFYRMLRSSAVPSSATIASTLAACAHLGSLIVGSSIHGYVTRQKLKLDIPAYNSLLTMYAKCGHLIRSHALFDSMKYRDVVSWNAIINGYAQHGHLYEAFLLFNKMRMLGEKPDSVTVVSLLQACACLGVLHLGKQVHNFIVRNVLNSSIKVGTGLVDMYSKCGNLQTAQRCFNGMPHQDIVSWSALIAGYGSHGKGEKALKLYSDFLQTGMKPNHIIFLSVLTACSHAGLVSEGLAVYQSMTEDFSIKPNMEHHACLVDLLCRARQLEEAYSLVVEMLPGPTSDILGILLDACKTQKTAKLGEVIAKRILELKPVNAGNYVQLAQCYASMGRWDGVGEAWTKMRSLGLKKTPGWSFIELNGFFTVFYMGHSSHPHYKEIVQAVTILDEEMSDTLNISNV